MSGKLETILTVVSGRAMLQQRRFKWGEAIPQFSVGSQGDWIVAAPGVAGIHVLLTFDGRQMHAASVSASAPAYLQNTPINTNWNAMAVGAELRFGEARIKVACEPVGARTAHSAPPQAPAAGNPAGPAQNLVLPRVVAAAAGTQGSPVPAPPIPPAQDRAPVAGAQAQEAPGGTQLMADYRGELGQQRTQQQPTFQAANAPLRVLGGPSSPVAQQDSTQQLNRTLPLQPGPRSAQQPPHPQINPGPGLISTLRMSPEQTRATGPLAAQHNPLTPAAPAQTPSPDAPPGHGAGYPAQATTAPGYASAAPGHPSSPPGHSSVPPGQSAPPGVAGHASSYPPAANRLDLTVGVPGPQLGSSPPDPNVRTLPSDSQRGPRGPVANPATGTPAAGAAPELVHLSMDEQTVVEKAPQAPQVANMVPGEPETGALSPTQVEAPRIQPQGPGATAEQAPMAPVGAPISEGPPASAPFSTLSDGGALRDLAAQIPPSPPDPPPPEPAAPQPQAAAPAALEQGALPATTPGGHKPSEPSMLPAPGAQNKDDDRKPSVLKKVTLALFLVAAGLMVYGQFVMPRLATRATRHAAKASASSTHAAAAASALMAKASASKAQPAPAAAASQAPAAPPSAGAADAPAEKAAESAPNEKPGKPTPLAGADSSPVDPASAQASRGALDAAFEGRLEEAQAQYKTLSQASDSPLYLLAAQHLERGSVRRP